MFGAKADSRTAECPHRISVDDLILQVFACPTFGAGSSLRARLLGGLALALQETRWSSGTFPESRRLRRRRPAPHVARCFGSTARWRPSPTRERIRERRSASVAAAGL